MRIEAGTANNVYYALKDHLGSASVMTDASGTVVGEQRFYPFGETRWSTGTIAFTDKLYTGQREMAGLGIYHYGARFYSPKLGRFLSPDTVVPGAGNPQAFNRYSYVLNNPLMYIDPSGHNPCRSDYLCGRRAEKRAAVAATTRVGSSGDIVLHTGTSAQPEAQQARNDMCDTFSCSDGVFTSGGSYTSGSGSYGSTSGGGSVSGSGGGNGGGSGQPLYSPKPNPGGDINPCHTDPDCKPYYDQTWSETQLNDTIWQLEKFEDHAVGVAIIAGVIGVAAGFLWQPEVGIAAAFVVADALWETYNANKLEAYLTTAIPIAQSQGGVGVTLSHRDDVYAGIPVVFEYEGADGPYPITSPVLSSAFDEYP
jgi:RHS repeat-associated protein